MPLLDHEVWTGNIGEWGEAFTLLHLLAHNRLHNADLHGQKIEHEYSLIEAMMRTETSGINLMMAVEDDIIVAHIGENQVVRVPKSEFVTMAHRLFKGMLEQGTTEAYPAIQEFLERLGCEGLKASSQEKADISARVYESFLASRVRRDYSIKTVVGGKPSLANASAQSYIDYELPGFDADKQAQVMSIGRDERGWVVKRVERVLELVTEPPRPVVRSRVFNRNLLKCHFRGPKAIGSALMYGQLTKGKPVIESIAKLKELDPAGFGADELDDYEDAMRAYLRGIVFDLDPGTPWKGPSQVDGYLLVTNEEEVLAYQVSRQRSFEDYLLLHTCWDTPSTSRYEDIGRVWRRDDGVWMFGLNCVIRYNEKEYQGDNAVAAGIPSDWRRL